jgi:Fe-S cluster assembly protein SufB
MEKDFLQDFMKKDYEYGFSTNIESFIEKVGLNEEIISKISSKKNEPKWMLDFRLDSFEIWKKMEIPIWANLKFEKIDFQKISYFSSPKNISKFKSLEEVDKELLDTFQKLKIPIHEQKKLAGIAVDIVFDSVSIGTTFDKTLEDLGIIFCSFSQAVEKYPTLIREYLSKVVPKNDNFFAALNSAVFSDGSFCFIPENIKCPVDLSTYFRINSQNTGQFERTLIIAEKNSSVSYLEGCSAPIRKENQLHAAVVEIFLKENAEVKYSTIQNWYPGDKNGNGGIYNFVTKRGICDGKNSKLSWTQVETGSSITWKYPSCILKGENSVGEFYSIAATKNKQQADTGTKMIHIGKNSSSKIISKGISANSSTNTYRGLVKITKNAENSKNFSQCDSLIFGNECSVNTFPVIQIKKNKSSKVMHEATTSKIDQDIIFYMNQRGISTEVASGIIVGGFCDQILSNLPMEFTFEAKKLLSLSFEETVG